MRFFFLYFLISIFYFHSFGQNKKADEFNFSKYHKKQFSLKHLDKKDFAEMDSDQVQVLDWREDTTCIGFQRKNYFTIDDIRTTFKNQLLSLIDFKKGSNLSNSKVVVCVKQIWITHHLTEVNNEWKPGAIWKVECFKKLGNQFTYLCSLDTTMETKSARFSPFDLVPVCLQLSAQKIESALREPSQSTRYADLNQFKNHFDNIPILHEAQKKKGLYMNYEQFLSNTPAAAKFEVEKDKLTDGLFVINSPGAYELVRNIWGYCDGQNMFIKSGEKYYQLCRVNNTFYFYGAKHVKKSVYSDLGTASLLNLATNTNRKITTYYLPSFPFQLNISNGDFY